MQQRLTDRAVKRGRNTGLRSVIWIRPLHVNVAEKPVKTVRDRKEKSPPFPAGSFERRESTFASPRGTFRQQYPFHIAFDVSEFTLNCLSQLTFFVSLFVLATTLSPGK